MMRTLLCSALICCSATVNAGVVLTRIGESDGVTEYADQDADHHAPAGSIVRSQAQRSGLSGISAQATATVDVLKSSTTLSAANPLSGGMCFGLSRWEDTLRMENASKTGHTHADEHEGHRSVSRLRIG